MNEDVVYSAAHVVGFTPLELVLMGVITLLGGALWRFVQKHTTTTNLVIKENAVASNNLANAVKGLQDEMARKLKKATKL